MTERSRWTSSNPCLNMAFRQLQDLEVLTCRFLLLRITHSP